jgi:hypothetical protein
MRHPQYLEIPLHLHWEAEHSPACRRWRRGWLIILLALAAIFLIGVSVTGGSR